MRSLWLGLCCVLAAVNIVQADSYRSRDRDDGFNPMGMMRDIPSPMHMFDSSDRRRDDHRRRRPLPYRPYYPAYPGMPPYGYPHAAHVPYGQFPSQPIQGAQPNTIQPGSSAIDSEPTTVQAPESFEQATTPSTQRPQPAITYDQDPQTGYSFRPMTPIQQDTEQIEAPETSNEPSYPAYTAPPAALPAISPKVYSDSQEPAMINGKPAVFRPMHLGTETSAD